MTSGKNDDVRRAGCREGGALNVEIGFRKKKKKKARTVQEDDRGGKKYENQFTLLII